MICIISRKYSGKHIWHVKNFDSAPIRTHEGERDKETSEVVQYIKQSTRNIVEDKKIYPKTGTRKCRFQLEGWMHHGLINYIDVKAKYRQLKK